MRLPAVLALACLPVFAQEKPPAEVDEALKARISKFYQAHVDGKFRSAEQFVAEDSKDFFFEIEKQRYLSFQEPQITYSDQFTKAKVITVVKAELRIARMGKIVVTPPIVSAWKLEDGQWYWYHMAEKYLETPFGRSVIPDEKEVERERKIAEFKKVSPAELVSQVKVSGSAVALSSYEPASGAITVTNNLPGQVTVDFSFPPVEGLTVSVDKKTLKSGESAKVSFDSKPPNSNPKGTITGNIVVQPLNQTFPVTVTFAVPRPVRSQDVNH
ncbi:MAG: hypothetical protein ABJF23_33585 [Bryobacteraceae bacterium]